MNAYNNGGVYPRTLWSLRAAATAGDCVDCILTTSGPTYDIEVRGLGATLRWSFPSEELATTRAAQLERDMLVRGWAFRDRPVV